MARASAFQAEGREFESRLPLHNFPERLFTDVSGPVSFTFSGGILPPRAIQSLDGEASRATFPLATTAIVHKSKDFKFSLLKFSDGNGQI